MERTKKSLWYSIFMLRYLLYLLQNLLWHTCPLKCKSDAYYEKTHNDSENCGYAKCYSEAHGIRYISSIVVFIENVCNIYTNVYIDNMSDSFLTCN